MTKTQARGFVIFLFLALAISAAAFAAKPTTEPFALGEATISASSIQWQATGAYERVILTVSGPEGFSFSKEFPAGRAPMLRVQDLGTNGPVDGSYTWELRLIPRVSPELKAKLAAARQAGDDVAAARIQAEAHLNQEYVQSGGFTVQNAAIAVGVGEEPPAPGGRKVVSNGLKPAPLDIVQADDVIIQGSLCVGLDCVNNESFGFDTIRLKENNTRIKFDDTSTAAGFPNNDWQLTANDSASGGANKFSIEDITGSKVPFTITAGAATNSIFVDSTGRLGLRTSTPVLDIHTNTGNTPAMRLEQNSSGGFTAQTWDIAGNEANFFVRDVTSGSRLPFRIRPGAPTSSIDISASGQVGVGTASPSEQLTVNGTGNVRTFVISANNNTAGLNMQVQSVAGGSVGFGILRTENNGDMDLFTGTSGAAVSEHMRVTVGGNVGINCNAPTFAFMIGSGSGCSTPTSGINPGSTSFTTASSRTFKENLAEVKTPDILDKISHVNVYNYDFINGPKNRLGLMAEDFHTIFARGSDKYIDGQDIQMALWLAVQQLTAQNKELKDRLNALESKLETKQQ